MAKTTTREVKMKIEKIAEAIAWAKAERELLIEDDIQIEVDAEMLDILIEVATGVYRHLIDLQGRQN